MIFYDVRNIMSAILFNLVVFANILILVSSVIFLFKFFKHMQKEEKFKLPFVADITPFHLVQNFRSLNLFDICFIFSPMKDFIAGIHRAIIIVDHYKKNNGDDSCMIALKHQVDYMYFNTCRYLDLTEGAKTLERRQVLINLYILIDVFYRYKIKNRNLDTHPKYGTQYKLYLHARYQDENSFNPVPTGVRLYGHAGGLEYLDFNY
jgi:hypothetical protein